MQSQNVPNQLSTPKPHTPNLILTLRPKYCHDTFDGTSTSGESQMLFYFMEYLAWFCTVPTISHQQCIPSNPESRRRTYSSGKSSLCWNVLNIQWISYSSYLPIHLALFLHASLAPTCNSWPVCVYSPVEEISMFTSNNLCSSTCGDHLNSPATSL